jgi:hypothetical protein
MKSLFLLVSIFSFLGVSGINQISEGQMPSLWLSLSIIFTLLLSAVGSWYYKYHYSKTIDFLIDSNTEELKKRISSYEIDIDRIREKISNTRKKMFGIGEIDIKIKEVADSNISLWEDQIDIHRKIIYICRTRISSLAQKQNELDLLNHLITEVKSEPNTEKKLKELKSLVSKIDNNVKSKFNTEVYKLIRELKTGIKKDKIIQLKHRVKELECTAS